MSFDYYCENKLQQKGHVEYDLISNRSILIETAPIEKNKDLYANKAITFAKEMINTNQSERIFIWY